VDSAHRFGRALGVVVLSLAVVAPISASADLVTHSNYYRGGETPRDPDDAMLIWLRQHGTFKGLDYTVAFASGYQQFRGPVHILQQYDSDEFGPLTELERMNGGREKRVINFSVGFKYKRTWQGAWSPWEIDAQETDFEMDISKDQKSYQISMPTNRMYVGYQICSTASKPKRIP
jgi:hypothetical protein